MATGEIKLTKIAEYRSLERQKLSETESEIRKSLADARLELFSQDKSGLTKKRNLKKNLARLLTARTEASKGAPKVAVKVKTVSSKSAAAKKSVTKKK